MKKIYFILLVLIIFITTPLFSLIYKSLVGPISLGFWGLSHPEYVSGFFMSYMFFIALGILLIDKSKIKLTLILLGIIILINLFLGSWEDLFIDIGFGLIGFLLAQSILFIKKKSIKPVS